MLLHLVLHFVRMCVCVQHTELYMVDLQVRAKSNNRIRLCLHGQD